ncbi:hypothetical protein KVV02_004058 [Mortierella alpina]|uniref:AAA ATPase AAA+ lid domain-containing protein n=1 Tax=Mortierella alpina TaxID=64518 RepID=A0A9P8ABM7_MORAP|nr:hypothetical protein KVV02_004058 [Mortierella alpina]
MEELGIKPVSTLDASLKQKETGSSIEQPEQGPLAHLASNDLYTRYKNLQRHLEFLQLQEEYIKDEQKNLKRELIRAQEEVKRIQSVPLVIGQFLEPIDQHTGIVSSTTGAQHVVRILSTIDRELLKPSCSMNLSDEVDLEDFVSRPDKLSGAEIAAICQEAGMHAVRKNRYVILAKDLEKGYKSNVKKTDTDFEFYK